MNHEFSSREAALYCFGEQTFCRNRFAFPGMAQNGADFLQFRNFGIRHIALAISPEFHTAVIRCKPFTSGFHRVQIDFPGKLQVRQTGGNNGKHPLLPPLGNILPVQALLSYRYADFFLLALLLFAAFRLLTERSNQIWPVVHAAKGGRVPLALRRCVVLAVCALVYVALLYGSTLLEAMLLYRADWSLAGIAAQSAEVLRQFPVSCTVLGLFVRLFLFRLISAVVIALVLWMLFSAFPQGKLMIVAMAVVLAAEYSFYTFLPDNSLWNILKYGNLFCLVFSASTFCTYFNLNFFSYPVNLRMLGIVLCVVLGLVSITVCVLVQWKKRPYRGRKRTFGPEGILHRCSEAVCGHFGNLGYALYHSLVLRHGWVVFLCFFVYCTQARYTAALPDTELNGYYAQLEGPVSAETYEALDKLLEDNAAEMAQADLIQSRWADVPGVFLRDAAVRRCLQFPAGPGGCTESS